VALLIWSGAGSQPAPPSLAASILG
jgi:hypothetical protein